MGKLLCLVLSMLFIATVVQGKVDFSVRSCFMHANYSADFALSIFYGFIDY